MNITRYSTALIIAAVALSGSFSSAAPEKGKASGAGKPAQEKPEAKEPAGKADVSAEAFGPLALGKSPAEVEKALGKPASMGKKVFQEATGTSVQEWKYPAAGLTVTMEWTGKKPAVGAIRAEEGCKLATARGIKLGSTEAEVAKAYAKEREAETSKAGESFVAGSIYGGVIFSFKDGKVSGIFIGAGAE